MSASEAVQSQISRVFLMDHLDEEQQKIWETASIRYNPILCTVYVLEIILFQATSRVIFLTNPFGISIRGTNGCQKWYGVWSVKITETLVHSTHISSPRNIDSVSCVEFRKCEPWLCFDGCLKCLLFLQFELVLIHRQTVSKGCKIRK